MWPKYTTPRSSKDTTNPPSNLLSGEDKDLTPSVLDCPPTVHTASLAPSNPDFIAFIQSFKELPCTIFYSISSNQNQNPFSGIHQFCLTLLDDFLQVGSSIHYPFSQTSQTLSPSSSTTRLMLSSGSILMYSATGIIIVGPSNRVTTPSLLWLLSIVLPINVLWLSQCRTPFQLWWVPFLW